MQDRAASGTDADNRLISRYGVVFNSDSLPLVIENEDGDRFTIIERITRASIKDADMEDMICARNHDFDKILGRRSNGTMSVQIDDSGIKYTTNVCKTSYGDDTLENVRRNDIAGSSFVFSYDIQEGYEIQERVDGIIIASPKRITKIYEMGPVTSPAYLGTIQNRSDDLAEAVTRYMKDKNKRSAEANKSGESTAEKRAMDAMDMIEAVSAAFYERFDWKDDYYYYIQSISLNNSLVAKEFPSRKLYRVNFSIAENGDVEFDDKSDWVQVQREYVEVTAGRAFYDAMNKAKMKRDGIVDGETNALKQEEAREEETPIEYPMTVTYKAKANVMKKKNKRV